MPCETNESHKQVIERNIANIVKKEVDSVVAALENSPWRDFDDNRPCGHTESRNGSEIDRRVVGTWTKQNPDERDISELWKILRCWQNAAEKT